MASRPTAGDHLDQLLAAKPRLVQIGRPAGRAWITTPVAIDAVAKLAICLVANADSGPSRTVIPAHCGQHSGDRGQFLMSV
jgi:hypothetical protein